MPIYSLQDILNAIFKTVQKSHTDLYKLCFRQINKSYMQLGTELQFSYNHHHHTCSPVSMFKAQCGGYQTQC